MMSLSQSDYIKRLLLQSTAVLQGISTVDSVDWLTENGSPPQLLNLSSKQNLDHGDCDVTLIDLQLAVQVTTNPRVSTVFEHFDY